MTLDDLSYLVLKFFGNGTVKISDMTLTQPTIRGYLKNAYVAVAQSIIDRKKRSGELDSSYLISGAIKTDEFDIEVEESSPTIIDLTGKEVSRMDNAMQIIGFSNVKKDCGCGNVLQQLDNITYVSPYEAKFYKGAGYEGLLFFVLVGNGIEVYNLPTCLKKIAVQYVKDSGDVDIAGDVCLQMCKVAFPDIFGVKKYDKPKVDDNSNSSVENLKLQIDAQG